jgi:hypothetical protein
MALDRSERGASDMKRTTVMLPAELHARATARARREGVSLGELIREALAARLKERRGKRAEDPLFADRAVYDGPVPADVSANHDKYLYDDP